MKKLLTLLIACLVALPLPIFAVNTTDIVIQSGVESMALVDPCGGK